jgi:outer membrane protein
MVRLTGLLLISLGWQFSQAQSDWTLQRAIDHALQNNITIKQGQLTVANNKLNYIQSKEALLPSVSGFANHNFSFGRNINPVNNSYVQQNVQSSQFGISSQVVLFNGLQNTNNIKLNKLNSEVSAKDLEVISNTISLQIATQFLQILFNSETVKTYEMAITSTEKQLERANILFQAGNTNQSSVFEMEAKLASDKLNLVTAQNNHRLSLVSLANLLQVPFDETFKIENPQVGIPEEVILEGTASIYDKASKIMPEVELSILRFKASLMQQTISKGSYSPTLSLNANVSTLFSDNFKDVINPYTTIVPIGYVQTTNDVVLSQGFGYDGTKTRPFSNQVNDNLGKSIGFSLNVPIYSNGRTRTSVKQAELATEQQKLNMLKTKNELYTSVATALANYTGAKAKFNALTEALNSQKKNYEFNKVRFDAGALSSMDLVISQTNYETAEANLLQGKYDLVFRKVLLDFYRGKPLVLK